MTGVVTITSKRQITLPSSLFKKAKLKEGQKLLLKEEKGSINIQPLSSVVESLAGSVKIPKRFKGKDIETIIEIAKKEHFSKNR